MGVQSVTFILSPYHVGLRNHRVGNGPDRILQWGVTAAVEKLGVKVDIVEIEPVDNFEGEIGRSFEILRRTSRLVTDVVSRNSFPIILSGNCMASVGVACGLGRNDLGFVYFDAHDDMDTPSTNENGYLDAMGLSMLKGESFHALWKTVPGHEISKRFKRDKFLYCGLRDIGDQQKQTVRDSGAQVIWGGRPTKTDFAAELQQCLKQETYGSTLVHLDLDVLDESLGKVNGYESPGGLLEDDLLKCAVLTAQLTEPTSLTVCSFDPDLGGGHQIGVIAVRAITRFVATLVERGVIGTEDS